MEDTTRATGVEQAGALPRVMRELIRTPMFRELLKLNLQESPPGTAAELARTILWEDVDVTLSLLGSSPQAVNFVCEFLVEAGRQFQNFPAEVLQIFIRQMGEKVDLENLQALPGAVSPVIDTLVWSDPAAVQGLRNLLASAANASLWGASGVLAPPGGSASRGRKEDSAGRRGGGRVDQFGCPFPGQGGRFEARFPRGSGLPHRPRGGARGGRRGAQRPSEGRYPRVGHGLLDHQSGRKDD